MKNTVKTEEKGMNELKKLIVYSLILFGVFHLLILILVLMPRKYTRKIRHFLARLLMIAGWHLPARLASLGHDVLWQKGNGH